MSKQKQVHLYVQIPFCETRCPFCRFTRAYRVNELTDLSLIPEFLPALEREMQSLDTSEMEVLDIQFGGGSPTLLQKGELKLVLDMLGKYFNIPGDCQISIDALPNTLDPAKIDELSEVGFNRINLGVQSTNDFLLEVLNRKYNREKIFQTVELLKSKGITLINVDLISGLPGQNPEEWGNTLKDVLAMDVPNITVNNFMTNFKGFEQFMERVDKFGLTAATTEQRVQLMKQAYTVLREAGYENYLGHFFCKPGTRYDYEIDIFVANDNVISFGPGVQTIYDNKIIIKAGDISGYIENPLGIKKLVLEDYVEDYIRLNFFTVDGINKERFESKFKISFEEGLAFNDFVKNLVLGLEEHDLLERDQDGVRVKRGLLMDGIVFLHHYFDQNNI